MPLVLDDDKLAAFIELVENDGAQTLHRKGSAEPAACPAECPSWDGKPPFKLEEGGG